MEIESITNSRPLSYTTSSDLEEPLTPSHLLVGRRVLNLPDNLGYTVNSDDEEIDSSQLHRRSKHLANTLNHFWKRWRTEYLTELRESHRRSTPDCSTKLKRGTWLLCMMRGHPEGSGNLEGFKELLLAEMGRFGGPQ